MFRDTSSFIEDESSLDLSEVVSRLLASIKEQSHPLDDIKRAVDAKFDTGEFAARLLALIDLDALNRTAKIDVQTPYSETMRDRFTEIAYSFFEISTEHALIIDTILNNVVLYLDTCNLSNTALIYQISVLALCRSVPSIGKFATIQPLTTPVGRIFNMRVADGGLEIAVNTVTATTRKYINRFNYDAINCDNLDTMEYMAKVLAYEMVKDVFDTLVTSLISTNTNEYLDLNYATTNEVTQAMLRAAGNVAHKGKRGTANVMLISSKMYFSGIFGSVFDLPELDEYDNKIIKFIGSYHCGYAIDVYLHPFGHDNEIIFLYKGNSNTDAGMVHSPYIPLQVGGIVVNPVTFGSELSTLYRGVNTLINTDLFEILTILPKNA